MFKLNKLLALVAVLSVGCASLPPAFHGIMVDKEKSFVIAQTSAESIGWGKLNHPFLRRVGDDRIALTYWVAGDGRSGGKAPVAWPAYSDDNFATVQFGDPFSWVEGATPDMQLSVEEGGTLDGSFDKGLFFGHAQLADGRFFMHQRRHIYRRKDVGVGIRQIERNGPYKTVSVEYHWKRFGEEQSSVDPNDIPSRFVVESSAVTGLDGCLYTVGYGDRMVNRKNERYKTYLFKSCDDGENFYFVSVVADGDDCKWGRLGPCEPAILSLGDDSFLVVMRTDGGGAADNKGTSSTASMLSAISTDGGKTWTHRRMPIPGVMPKLLRLSNGLIVVAHGRPNNNLSFSKDNGLTWTGMQGITPTGWKTTGYMDMIEVSENRLFLVFDQIDMPVTGGLVSHLIIGPSGYVNAIHGMFVTIKYSGE